jgi:deoxyribodipyrimidine photo-lyase
MTAPKNTASPVPTDETVLPWLESLPRHWSHKIKARNSKKMNPHGDCVIYWMQRSQRAVDNPALNVAISAANALKKPLYVLFNLVSDYPHANARHYAFMLHGLSETAMSLGQRGAGFLLRLDEQGDPARVCSELNAALLVGDENYLRRPRRWRATVADHAPVGFYTVEAHTVIPSRLLAKEEYAARTIRPKIHRLLDRFLVAEPEPEIKVRPAAKNQPASLPLEVDKLLSALPLDSKAQPLAKFPAGTAAGMSRLATFIARRLNGYPEKRKHPEIAQSTSRLSPYLHFGQLGPRAIALAVLSSGAKPQARDAFLEELIVRRELAINFIKHNAHYDDFAGLPAWGQKTLAAHQKDPRPYLYSKKKLENAETHDPLWNAAQKEMVWTGFMHGYMRMYWVKKILQWSRTPRRALRLAQELNDRYELDGRDPNGYANIAWGIGGKHDRPWPQHDVFGKVRSMTYKSTSRKFDTKAYIKRVDAIIK